MFDFIALGDWGYISPIREDIAQTIQKKFQTSLLIFLGDNFYPTGVKGVHDPQWKLYERDFKNPSYAIVGNHDYLGSINAQISYSIFSDTWNMPFTYYDVVRDGCHLIFLDTAILAPHTTKHLTESMGFSFHPIEERTRKYQLVWLTQTLRHSTCRTKIVFGHYPIYSGGGHGNCSELIMDVLPIFRTFAVTMYISGHDHSLQHIERHGIQFYVSGAGSESARCRSIEGTRFYASTGGFVHISCLSDKTIASFVSADGMILYENHN